MILIIDNLVGRLLDVVGGDGINASEKFRIGHSAAISEDLTANFLGNIGQAVKVHEERSLQLSLGSVDLSIGDVVAQADKVIQRAVHQVIKLVIRSNQVETEEASVLVGSVKSGEAVSQVVFSDLRSQLGADVASRSTGAVPRSQQSLHQHKGNRVLRCPRSALEGDGNVGLLYNI